MKHALLIPFHFPPIQGSTGALRSLAFSRWLPEFGWRATVLTVKASAYPTAAPENLQMIPSQVTVKRAAALDAQRHLSIRGRYLRFLAYPDRWSTWIPTAVSLGLGICRSDRPDVLYSTYPIPSSHVIAWILHRATGIPWVAEFRDPMVEENYPPVASERNVRRFIESKIFARASRIVVVTESARRLYEERSGKGAGFVVEIPNGYEEESGCAAEPVARSDRRNGPLVVLHSGVLYAGERHPGPMLKALAELSSEGELREGDVEFVFRGAGNEAGYRSIVQELGLSGLVEFRDAVPYAVAREEMSAADALLVLQGSMCNRQIPAKAYEYLATGKPVLCLADPSGDTASLFKSLGLDASAALEDVPAIKAAITKFLRLLRAGTSKSVDLEAIRGMSRRARTGQLADLLERVRAEAMSGGEQRGQSMG